MRSSVSNVGTRVSGGPVSGGRAPGRVLLLAGSRDLAGEPFLVRQGQRMVAEVHNVVPSEGRALLGLAGRHIWVQTEASLQRGQVIHLQATTVEPEQVVLRLVPGPGGGEATTPASPGSQLGQVLAQLNLPNTPQARAIAEGLLRNGLALDRGVAHRLLAITRALPGPPGTVLTAGLWLVSRGLPLTAKAVALVAAELGPDGQPMPLAGRLAAARSALAALREDIPLPPLPQRTRANPGRANPAPANPQADAPPAPGPLVGRGPAVGAAGTAADPSQPAGVGQRGSGSGGQGGDAGRAAGTLGAAAQPADGQQRTVGLGGRPGEPGGFPAAPSTAVGQRVTPPGTPGTPSTPGSGSNPPAQPPPLAASPSLGPPLAAAQTGGEVLSRMTVVPDAAQLQAWTDYVGTSTESRLADQLVRVGEPANPEPEADTMADADGGGDDTPDGGAESAEDAPAPSSNARTDLARLLQVLSGRLAALARGGGGQARMAPLATASDAVQALASAVEFQQLQPGSATTSQAVLPQFTLTLPMQIGDQLHSVRLRIRGQPGRTTPRIDPNHFQATVNLDLPRLGPVEGTVRVHEKTVRCRLEAAGASSRAALMQAGGELRAAWTERGYRVDSLVCVTGDASAEEEAARPGTVPLGSVDQLA